MSGNRSRLLLHAIAGVLASVALTLVGSPLEAQIVGPITFAPGDYDNTANTVIAGPTPVYNQTSGKFRDVIWWSINNGLPRVGSDDFINQGNNLLPIPNTNHSGPNGSYTALNFTGPSISGGQSYLSVYDTTPADSTATENLFDAQTQTGIEISADVLFAERHNVAAGVASLYSEGQNALALLANNVSGNNQDHTSLDLVWQSTGQGTLLDSVTIPSDSFELANWYRVTMDLTVSGDTWTVTGTFRDHVTGTDPTSALDGVITTMNFNGSLSNQNLTNPGEVGLLVMGRESISLPDTVGVSFTNFEVVPEPSTLVLAALGLVGGMLFGRRTRDAKFFRDNPVVWRSLKS